MRPHTFTRSTVAVAVAVSVASGLCAAPARADEWGLDHFHDPFAAEDPTQQPGLTLDGYFRTRGDLLHNLDLDRGPTPSTGETLYPTPGLHPGKNDTLTSANSRLRLIPRISVGWEVNVYAMIDALDNVVLGSTPSDSTRTAAMNAASTAQGAPKDSLKVKRAWAEIGTPIGLLAAGRMGAHWGMGVVANDGNSLDADLGNTVDAISLAVPLLSHIFGFGYEIASTGSTFDRGNGQAVDADPADDVHSLSLAVLSMNTPAVARIKHRDGRDTLDYGVVLSYRWQDYDYPQSQDGTVAPAATAIKRGFTGLLADAYGTWETPHNRLETEFAVLSAKLKDASLLAGLHTETITALQYGGVLRDTWQCMDKLALSLETGLASGDSAPGFGVRSDRDRDRARKGDLDGPQVSLPDDTSVNNFRFHPDYHIDLILWREIVGTVTDAFYLRPKVVVSPGMGFTGEAALVYSQAMEATSAPGGKRPLGVEADFAVRYKSEDRFVLGLEYGVLQGLSGLDNPDASGGHPPGGVPIHLSAGIAQRVHATLGVLF